MCFYSLFQVKIVQATEQVSDPSISVRAGAGVSPESGFSPITKVQRTVTKTLNSESAFGTSPSTTKVKLVSGGRGIKSGKVLVSESTSEERGGPVSVVVTKSEGYTSESTSYSSPVLRTSSSTTKTEKGSSAFEKTERKYKYRS